MNQKEIIEESFLSNYQVLITVEENCVLQTRVGDRLGIKVYFDQPMTIKFTDLNRFSNILGTEHMNFKLIQDSITLKNVFIIEAWD